MLAGRFSGKNVEASWKVSPWNIIGGAIESSETTSPGTRASSTEHRSDNYKEIECERAVFIGCDRASHRRASAEQIKSQREENLCQRLLMPRIYGFDYRRGIRAAILYG